MALADPPAWADGEGMTLDPVYEMWVFRYREKNGQDSEVHQRRDQQANPAGAARVLANQCNGVVHWTSARTQGAMYHWNWVDDERGHHPTWRVTYPTGGFRGRVVACPNMDQHR
jgi:hypothetical protein